MERDKADFLICGGGIIGVTIARELLNRGCENIIILEKEGAIGEHASGRNSGVLHAGIYYTPDSMKAKLCLQGNFLMKRYCKEKALPLLEPGKVIVAKNENETETIKELYNRAVKNGAKVELIDEKQLQEIEPNAKTHRVALYSYYTAVVDPKAILGSFYDDLASSGKVKFFSGTEFKRLIRNKAVLTNKGEIQFDNFINAAGAYSDKIAHSFGVGLDYKLIPFKGIYKKLTREKSYMVKGNIYPVPDIRNPFLGIHLTKSTKGDVYLGPTAITAFGRENYRGVKGMNSEAIDILARCAALFFVNPEFRRVALTEPRKYIFKFFFEDIKKLIRNLEPEDIMSSGKVGIRPQLVDWKKKELVMDFVVIKDGDSTHVLNAISPAFTSSLVFAKLIVERFLT